MRAIFRHDYYADSLETDQIRIKYGILSVGEIVAYDTAILAYRIKNNLIKNDVELNYNSERHNYHTRNSSNIYQNSYRTNAGKFLISRQVAVSFNFLTNEMKNIRSITTFKKELKIVYVNRYNN